METLRAQACDGSEVDIRCPDKTKVRVQWAQYGRSPDSDMCLSNLTSGHSSTQHRSKCKAMRSLEVSGVSLVPDKCFVYITASGLSDRDII